MTDQEQGQFSRELEMQNSAEQEVLAVEEVEEAEEETQAQEIEEEESENIELEQARLAEESADQQEAEAILQAGYEFGNPSMLKWGVIFILAFLNDGVDLLDLTGVLAILAWFISLGLTATILGILWFSDAKVKRANHFLANLNQPQVAQTGRAELRSELSRKWKQGSKSLAQKRSALQEHPYRMNIKDSVAGILRGGNPMTLTLIGSAVESVPYVDLINLVIVWVLVAYLQERKVYINARKAAEMRYSQLLASSV